MKRQVKIFSPPSVDGGALLRVIGDGETVWVESWRGPERGWEYGGADLYTGLTCPPASMGTLRQFGVPVD